jgi:hypothetical protein
MAGYCVTYVLWQYHFWYGAVTRTKSSPLISDQLLSPKSKPDHKTALSQSPPSPLLSVLKRHYIKTPFLAEGHIRS